MAEIHNPHLYVLFVLDGNSFFVPQDDVDSVEIIADVQKENAPGGAIGWFFGHGDESPVFCLAENFSLLSDVPKKREYLILLKAEPQPLGITCDEVENINLNKEHLDLQELPFAMKKPGSPISQLLIYQEKIAYVCKGSALVKHLQSFMEQNQ
jgi:chemotaxis signal transduction protein